MQNLISCRPESFGRYSDRAYEALQQLGIRHVELRVPRPDQVERTAEELKRYGLQASSVALYQKVQEPDFLDQVREAVNTADALGAKVMFTSQRTGDMERQRVYDLLRQAGESAAEKGVTIVLETHPDLCQNGRAALETMQAIDHPNVRVNFDPANVHYYNENVDAINELRQIAAYVRAVHLKDTNGGFHQWHFPAIGDGVVDWPSLFRIVNERGMFGPFTLEMEGIQGESLSYEETCARIERSLNYLRSNGLIS
ncbi:MAG: sugar phosphate isomerase/epimerase [Armatimonadota bacterium]|nr:sugar phosphate isomerase/epimerase [Armatimonadota bacterium]